MAEKERLSDIRPVLAFNKEQIDIIKNTIAKGATDDELKIFLYLASQYNLDPFKKEIWFTKYGSSTNIMTSRDGYLKYAQSSHEFEGLISFVVKEGDEFLIDAANYQVTHKFGIKRGRILGAWARCDRKGKRPFLTYVDFTEYRKEGQIWNQYPSAMIQKVAEVFVLKRAFGISGLVTREEIGSDGGNAEYIEGKEEEVNFSREATLEPASNKQRSFIWKLAQDKGMDEEALRNFSLGITGKSSSKEMGKGEADKLIKALQEYKEDSNCETRNEDSHFIHS